MPPAETCRHIPPPAATYCKLRNSTACHTYQTAFRETTGLPVTLEPAGWKTQSPNQNEHPQLAAPIRFGGKVVGHLVVTSLDHEFDRVSAQRLLTAYADRVGGLINFVLLELDDDIPDAVALAVSLAEFREDWDVSLCEVAERACIPAHNFTALFQHATELSFEDYLARRRLEKARRSLFIADASSVQAAADSIDVSKSDLRALFGDYLGESPEAYRHRMQKNHRALQCWPESPVTLASSRPKSKSVSSPRRRPRRANPQTSAAPPRTVKLSGVS